MAGDLSRELLIANLLLDGTEVEPADVAGALRRYWSTAAEARGDLLAYLARVLGLDDTAARELDQEFQRVLAEADGEAQGALARLGYVPRSVDWTLGTQLPPGQDFRAAPGAPGSGIEDLRVAGEQRFADCLVVGEGGMGIVYLAFDRELKRFVALKVIRSPDDTGRPGAVPETPYELTPPSADTAGAGQYEQLCSRFLQEAWITGGLEHPGIVPVYEVGRTPQGLPLYAMKFIGGNRTLADALDESRDEPLARRLRLLEPFLKVCDAVEYAHSRGVIHRDIKPSNIALGEYGEVLVLDWGLARIVDDAAGDLEAWAEHVRSFRDELSFQTQAAALGTLGYMAPEAAIGDHGAMGPASDVYSLGVILYELLTGRLPHVADSPVDWINKVDKEPVLPPGDVDAGVPAGLGDVALEALSRHPSARPASAGSLARRVRAWQESDEEMREFGRLLGEARQHLAAARDTRRAARLQHVERAALRFEQAERLGPAPAGGFAADEAELETLRRRGLRERTWHLVRMPLVGLVLLVLGVVGISIWSDVRSVKQPLEASEAALAKKRPIGAEAEARLALDRADALHDAWWPSEGLANSLAGEAFSAQVESHVQRGDLEGFTMAAAEGLARADERGGDLHCRSVVARAAARLGAYPAVCQMLHDAVGRSPADDRLLLDAYLRMGQRARARALALRMDATWTLGLLARYRPLWQFDVGTVLSVQRVEMGDGPWLVLATDDGALHLWHPGLERPRRLDTNHGLENITLRSERTGTLSVYGAHTAPGATHRRLVVVTYDFAPMRDANAAMPTEVRRTVLGPHSTPRVSVLDLDGDGRDERMLTHAANARGMQVLDEHDKPWSQERLGGLAPLSADHQPGPNTDMYVAAIAPAEGGRRTLLVGSGMWNLDEWGFGVVRCTLGPGVGEYRLEETHRLGTVESITHADLDRDGRDEWYLWNSYSPRVEMEAVAAEFRGAGVYRFEPHAVAIEEGVLAWTDHDGFFRDESDSLRVADVSWRCSFLAMVPLPDGGQALATGSDVGGSEGTREHRYLELIGHDGDSYRTFTLPGVQPRGLGSVLAVMDVDARAEGPEMIVVTKEDRVHVLGAAPADRPYVDDPGLVLSTDPLPWRLAEALRLQGQHRLAATIYEHELSAGFEGGSNVQRWLGALVARRALGDVPEAVAALTRAHATGQLSQVERDAWEARIALTALDVDGALDRYRAVRVRLESHAFREELRSQPGTLVADDIGAEAREAIAWHEPARHRSTHVWKPAGTATDDAVGAPALTPSDPLLVRPIEGTGRVAAVLDGRGRQWLHTAIELPEVHWMRGSARLRVLRQPWGSQLAFALSRCAHPAAPADRAEEDAILISLDRGDSTPRGVNMRARLGGVDGISRSGEMDQYVWRWGRPLRLEFEYLVRPGGVGADLRLRCVDEFTGEALHEGRLAFDSVLPAGTYRFGYWGTPSRNRWNHMTYCELGEVTLELRCRQPGGARGVPHPDATGPRPHPLERAWPAWTAGDEERALSLLLAGDPPVDRLAGWLIGPRPDDIAPLAGACMQRLPALESALFEHSEDLGTARVAADPDLLVALHRGGHLREPLDEDRRLLLARALVHAGDPHEAWVLLQVLDVPKDDRWHLKNRLARAIHNYRGHRAASASIDSLDKKAQLAVLDGAITAGEEVDARRILRRILSERTLRFEELREQAAIRRLLLAAD